MYYLPFHCLKKYHNESPGVWPQNVDGFAGLCTNSDGILIFSFFSSIFIYNNKYHGIWFKNQRGRNPDISEVNVCIFIPLGTENVIVAHSLWLFMVVLYDVSV